ncbi:MAG: transketolase [Alphaproteobacteria bacterium]|nr:transketolase [Alphaproteobacteria bacterium]
MKIDSKNLHEMSNTVRADALRAVAAAKSGHIGIVLGAADIITMIYTVFLNPARDRFVLSAGHGSAMLYAVLKLSGYNVGDLKSFRQIGGPPGHPEFGIDGVAATTGPLGQGVANAVGMAIAAKHNKTGGRVYCLCSDGDLMEGVAQEAIGFAGRYGLDNLVLLWDNNGLSIDGVAQVDKNVSMRMRAAGWTVRAADGTDMNELYDAISAPAAGPLFVRCDTTLGQGASVSGTARAHGFALGEGEVENLIKHLDSAAGRDLWRKFARGHKRTEKIKYANVPRVSVSQKKVAMSTREMSGEYLAAVMKNGADIIIGSADLGQSTNMRIPGVREITADNFSGRYINYGVREHAMAAIMNGMAYAGMRAAGSTFLVFSDYMRGAMRLAAISGLPVVYVLTHDSIAVGQDGPTHQPIEQLAGLRLIPNMNVFRPCNMAEVAWSWQTALSEVNRPSCIVLSRQSIAPVGDAVVGEIKFGAYVVYKSGAARAKMTIIATGAEVPLAISVAQILGGAVQVVSMPSVGHFRAMEKKYKDKILAGTVVAIEASSTAPWFEFADIVVGIDDFGLSGAPDMVYRACGFDAEKIASAIRTKIKHV